MEPGKVAHWLQIVANLGILAGIVLVFVQIRQSNEITGAQLFSDGMESAIARDLALIGETPERSMIQVMYEPETATREDYFVADHIYMAITRQFYRTIVLSEADLYGTWEGLDTQRFISGNAILFACPYGLAFLDQTIAVLPPSVGTPELGEAMASLRETAARLMAADIFSDRMRRAADIARQLDTLMQ